MSKVSEKELQSLLMIEASRLGSRVFRNNTGQAWVGKVVARHDKDIVLRNARPFHAGLCKGSSDLIGWTSLNIHQGLVGKRLALFTAIEVKSARGRLSKEQDNFLSVVETSGGLAIVARSLGDLEQLGKFRL